MLVLSRTTDETTQGTLGAKDSVMVEIAGYVERIGEGILAEYPAVSSGRLLQEIVASLPPAICVQLLQARSGATQATGRARVGIFAADEQQVLRSEICPASWNPTQRQTNEAV